MLFRSATNLTKSVFFRECTLTADLFLGAPVYHANKNADRNGDTWSADVLLTKDVIYTFTAFYKYLSGQLVTATVYRNPSQISLGALQNSGIVIDGFTQLTGTFKASTTDLYSIRFGHYSKAYNFLLAAPQIEASATASSYILTGGTAVTRAADIALINGQNIVNRWENDQQPIDTDTPRLLTNGEHDMSADRLVKFERETSAWLDGKEYAADEPRYVGGKLLVEPQATNQFKPISIVGFNYVSPNCTQTVNTETGEITVVGTGGGFLLDWYSSAHGTIMQMGYNYLYSVDVVVADSVITDLEVSMHCATGNYVECKRYSTAISLGGNKHRVYVIYSPTVKHSSYIVQLRLAYSGTQKIDAMVCSNFQLQKYASDTNYLACLSPIPTTTTAVTRAAEYAHVISKQAINTPTGLLPIGEHSVESTAIRSFKRDTIAWLDEVEYPANTPRYLSNGQLLIEPQDTNILPLSTVIDAYTGGGKSFVTVEDMVVNGETISVTRFPPTVFAPNNMYISSDLFCNSGVKYLTTWFKRTPNQKAAACFELGIFYVDLGTGLADRDTAGQEFSSWFDGDMVVLQVKANPNGRALHLAANQDNTADIFFIKQQVSSAGFYSYIPTNGTAVTRAADECFVDYQLPPNSYRDLKGFKK